MSDLDLTAVISAAAANLYMAEHGATSAISAAAMFAAMAEMAPPVARHYLERARFSVEAVAPLIERAVREQVAQELLAAGADPYQNLAWMYPEQAATIARRGSLAPAESSVSGAKAADQ